MSSNSDFRRRWRASELYPAFTWPARLARLGVRSAAAARATPVRSAPAGGEPLLERARQIWPGAASFAILIGTPGPAQKWTAEVRDEDGEVLGYIKGGILDAAVQRLKSEAALLPIIPASLAPRLLWSGPLAGGWAIATTAIEGTAPSPILDPPAGLVELCYGLAGPRSHAVADHPWAASFDGPEAVAALLDDLADREWPEVIQHGDCAPWNLRRSAAGSLATFDWELGCASALPGLDEVYYVLQVGFLIYGLSPRAAASSAQGVLFQRGYTACQAQALIRITAYDAWQKAESIGETGPLQAWRRKIWEDQYE